MEDSILLERYALSMERIRRILEEETVSEPFRAYFQDAAGFLLAVSELREVIMSGSFKGLKTEEKKAWNERLYGGILPGNYEKSYVNPTYAAKMLGEGMGKLLSFLYAEIRGDIVYAFEGRLLELVIWNEAFIEIYNLFEEGIPEEKQVRDVIYWCVSDYCDETAAFRIREGVDPTLDFAKKIIMESDLSASMSRNRKSPSQSSFPDFRRRPSGGLLILLRTAISAAFPSWDAISPKRRRRRSVILSALSV